MTIVVLAVLIQSALSTDYGSYSKVAYAQQYYYPAPSTSTVSPSAAETSERSTKSPYKPSPIFYAFGTSVKNPWPEVSSDRSTTPAPPQPQNLQDQTRVLGANLTQPERPQAVMEAPLGADRAFEGSRTPPEGAGLGGGQAFQGMNVPAPELGGSRAFENVNMPMGAGLGGSRAFESLNNPPISLGDLGGGRAFDPTSQDSSGLGGSRAFENVGPSVASAQLQGGQAF